VRKTDRSRMNIPFTVADSKVDGELHRFYLRPPDPIPVRRGRVQPAFGQPGGGVEVIFETGVPPRTKYKQDTIPPT
jgi:hypothetical protein